MAKFSDCWRLKVGMEVSIACPEGYHPDPQVLEFAKAYGDKFTLTDQPLEAAKEQTL